MKVINAKTHGILDYLTVVFLFLSPTLFGVDGTLATFTYILGVVHLLLTILTAFEVGLIKVIPFRVHGIIEIIVAIALGIVAYWFYTLDNLTGFYFYLVVAMVILLVFFLTDFTSATSTRPQHA
jgi:hypothetical protein